MLNIILVGLSILGVISATLLTCLHLGLFSFDALISFAVAEFIDRGLLHCLVIAGAIAFLSVSCCLSISLPALSWAEENVFEVKATAVDSVFYRMGKIERDRSGDEVVYQVNLPQKTITRTAVYNKSVKEQMPGSSLGGLESDNTVYQIVHDGIDLATHQRLLKAIGQAGSMDGYETVVVGEDFATTSRSAGDYFVLYSYKRTDPMADDFKKHGR